MSTQQIVPVDTKPFEAGLAKFRQDAESITVKDQGDYVIACQLALDVRAYIKDVKAKMKPGIESAQAHLNFLKNEMSKYITPAEQIDQTISRKAEGWKRAEREAAERERQRIQAEAEAAARRKAEEERREAERIAAEQRKEREAELKHQREAGEIKAREAEKLRKQAEEDERKARELAAKQAAETEKAVPVVTVAPAVPKVAGIKARVNWKFRILDASKVKTEFTMPDEVKIGQIVRSMKDKAGAEALVGGIEVYTEDSI